MKLSLVVQTPGKQEGKVLDIKLSQFLIGRDTQCHLRPASPMISKRHCAIIQRDDKAFIRDFDSTNGTLVNDQPIKGEVELHHGDRLKIGPLMFGVQLEATVAVSRPTPQPPTKNLAAGGQPAKPAAKLAAPLAADSPTPPPPTIRTGEAPVEDDVAAMLLSLQDDAPPTTPSGSLGPLPEIPDGSTVMNLKAPGADGTVPAEDGKGGTDKAKEKAKVATGNTSAAAKSILEKMMRRPRETS
jgi:predicted component of type VI protein secretion system